MNTKQNRAKSLIDDMLKRSAESLEIRMRAMINYQERTYQKSKERTIGKMLGQIEDDHSLFACFRYQETIGSTLREMERTFFEYFGKPWDFKEPVDIKEEPIAEEKPKRGRPRKK